MREILFRGKRVDNGEWVYGMPCATEKSGIYAIQTLQGGIFDIIPETLGQYTGLVDKNGKKIFEGDIIKCPIIYDIGCYPYTKTEIREVKYVEGCFVPFYNTEQNFYEVIGNIHDNPELLEVHNG